MKEIEAAIPRLTRAEVEEFRAWFEDFIEDQLELTDGVKAKLDQSREEIAGIFAPKSARTDLFVG